MVLGITTANIQTFIHGSEPHAVFNWSVGVSLALSYFGAPVCCSDFSFHPGLDLERQFQVCVRLNLENCNFSFSENVSDWDSGFLQHSYCCNNVVFLWSVSADDYQQIWTLSHFSNFIQTVSVMIERIAMASAHAGLFSTCIPVSSLCFISGCFSSLFQ